MSQTANPAPAHRLQLCESDCAVRDDRWEVKIDASDDPVNIRVAHRKHGDFYDWPEEVFDRKVRAAMRAYDLQDNEVTFHTRGKALAAAHSFLKSYGAGEVEYLEWDVNSQSMVVVGHQQRTGLWWPEAKPDPLAPFYPVSA